MVARVVDTVASSYKKLRSNLKVFGGYVKISSMTGFSHSEGQNDFCSWMWDLKSVNAKGLDVRCRVPGGHENLEKFIRKRVAKTFKRGNVTVILVIRWFNSDPGFRVNSSVLGEILKILPELKLLLPSARPPSVDGILSLRGVIESTDEALAKNISKELEEELMGNFEVALTALLEMRNVEGALLTNVLGERLNEISMLNINAQKLALLQPEAIRKRLKNQVKSLLKDIPILSEDRLILEIALLMSKADVREELDRLMAHEQAARDLIKKGGHIGRKLDFLCQEFNREANTLCAKSPDINLTRIGLDMKSSIEQFREQIQNIE